jgi:hypothetical protein
MEETSAQRAASVQQVIHAAKDEPPQVKQAAIEALGVPIPAPGRSASDILWVILVTGLVVLLILALLGLTHVIGTDVSDDKIVTVFTTVLAALLGLFVKSPTSS